MPLLLTKVDAVQLQENDLNSDLLQWLNNITDTLNSDLDVLGDNLSNGFIIPSFTSAQITALAVTAVDGTIWFSTDHVPPVLVAKINGALRQLTTTAFP